MLPLLLSQDQAARPLLLNHWWIPHPVPLTIYSILATMIPRANSPPGRLALRLDPQGGGALTQPVGLVDHEMTRATRIRTSSGYVCFVFSIQNIRTASLRATITLATARCFLAAKRRY